MAEKIMLNDVREGMTVYDGSGNKIGEVKFVYNGMGPMSEMPDIITAKEHIDKVMKCTTNLPTDLYKDLYREGFARIKRGFFKSDVIVIQSHILDLGADALFLDVPVADLPEC